MDQNWSQPLTSKYTSPYLTFVSPYIFATHLVSARSTAARLREEVFEACAVSSSRSLAGAIVAGQYGVGGELSKGR
jgi:hypothetical protein